MAHMFTEKIREDTSAQELNRKWIFALRSGNYKQSIGSLRNSHGSCCLGVGCDVYDPTKWFEDDYIGSGGAIMPIDVSEAFRLKEGDGSYFREDGWIALTQHNDAAPGSSKHLDFNGIADLIEAELALALA